MVFIISLKNLWRLTVNEYGRAIMAILHCREEGSTRMLCAADTYRQNLVLSILFSAAVTSVCLSGPSLLCLPKAAGDEVAQGVTVAPLHN